MAYELEHEEGFLRQGWKAEALSQRKEDALGKRSDKGLSTEETMNCENGEQNCLWKAKWGPGQRGEWSQIPRGHIHHDTKFKLYSESK